MPVEKRKKEWRVELEERRRKLSGEAAGRVAKMVAERLNAIERLADAEVVAGYWPVNGELDLRSFLKKMGGKGKTVCLPRRHSDGGKLDYEMAELEKGDADWNEGLTRGGFGIMEPLGGKVVDKTRIDAWLVPGVGFDRDGNRLGRGGGVYDELLDGASGLKIGVGSDCQVVESLPSEEHDRKMDAIVTEKETIWVG